MNSVGAVATGVSTVVFLVAKFTEGAWVVVIAIPLFIVLFMRISAYYERQRKQLGLGELPAVPQGRRTLVIVPVANVSRLTAETICEAESLGQEVIAVTVAFDDEEDDERKTSSGQERAALGHGLKVSELEREWRRWHPGVALRVLHTSYSSVVQPIVEFIDELRAERTDQIVGADPVRGSRPPLALDFAQPARPRAVAGTADTHRRDRGSRLCAAQRVLEFSRGDAEAARLNHTLAAAQQEDMGCMRRAYVAANTSPAISAAASSCIAGMACE